MDFGCFWKAPVRSEEKQQRSEGKSICPALARDESVILWRKRPCVDRIFGIVLLLSDGLLIEGSALIATVIEGNRYVHRQEQHSECCCDFAGGAPPPPSESIF